MSNAVLITANSYLEPLPSGENRVTPTKTYSVMGFEFQDDADCNQMLSGMAMPELREGAIDRIQTTTVTPPDGSPPNLLSAGFIPPSSVRDAHLVACRALSNPDSELRIRGFPEDCPIYHWQPGEPVTKLIYCE